MSGKTPGQAAHPLDLAAIAAFGAWIGQTDTARVLLSWQERPSEERSDWRAVADAVRMAIEAQSLDQVARSAAADGKPAGQAAFIAYEQAASGDPGYKPCPWENVDPRGRRNWDAAAQAAIDAAPADLTDLADWTELLREGNELRSELAVQRAAFEDLTGQLAGAREQLGQVADAASVVLDAFTRGSDGYRARLSGVTLMRAYKAIGRPAPDRLKHLEGQ